MAHAHTHLDSQVLETIVRLCDPKLLGEAKAWLQFAVEYRLVGGDVLLTKELGWRVGYGKVLAPARRAGKSYFTMVEASSRFQEFVEESVVELWREEFPSVAFPVAKVAVVESFEAAL